MIFQLETDVLGDKLPNFLPNVRDKTFVINYKLSTLTIQIIVY